MKKNKIGCCSVKNIAFSSDDSLENTLIECLNLVHNDKKECKIKDADSPMSFLDREVFPVLLPCIEEVLFEAKKNNVLKIQKSRFNGLDYLAELLWNRNPNHPERQLRPRVPIFDIPFVKTHLENNPRPVIPKSWLWTPEEAAVVIQAAVKGYFVRRSPAVQEMRQFWKALSAEKILKGEEDK